MVSLSFPRRALRRDERLCQEEGQIPERVGRRKLVVFASGRTFTAECLAAHADGASQLLDLLGSLWCTAIRRKRQRSWATLRVGRYDGHEARTEDVHPARGHLDGRVRF